MRDTFNANKLVSFFVRLEHLETIFVSFPAGETHYVIGNVYRLPNTNNNEFMSEISNILNNALTDFRNCIFYIMGNFNYDLISIN